MQIESSWIVLMSTMKCKGKIKRHMIHNLMLAWVARNTDSDDP